MNFKGRIWWWVAAAYAIRYDNRVENLEWCTPSENTIHAYKNGLIDLTKMKPGKNTKIPIEKFNQIIGMLNSGELGKNIAAKMGVSCDTITKIKNKRSWHYRVQ